MTNSFAGSEICACCGYFAFRQAARKPSSGAFTCEAPSAAVQASDRLRAPNDPRHLVIKGGTVIDPRTGARRADATVVVGQGQILSVGGEAPKVGADVEVLDAEGGFIVPGYNDMHSHVLELDDPSGALALMLAEGGNGLSPDVGLHGAPGAAPVRRPQGSASLTRSFADAG